MKTIALLTDLGLRDAYVGMMKGVIAGIAPDAHLIDITHQVPAHDLREGAFSLFASYRYFPEGTIFCCVVDPGVGSSRRALALEIRSEGQGSYTLVGPDNGLFTGAIYGMDIPHAVSLENPKYQLPEVSTTFHGRDIFAPAAAHLAAGVNLTELGPKVDPSTLAQLSWTEPREKEGGWEIDPIHADQFGNLVTNLPLTFLKPDPSKWRVWLNQVEIGPVRRTFSDARVGRPLAYVGSSGLLELAVRDGSAKELLSVNAGSVISVVQAR